MNDWNYVQEVAARMRLDLTEVISLEVLIMTLLYLKIKIATLEFEIAMLDAKMLQQNSDGLKSNKVELETRLFVIQLYHSQVVNDIAEDLKEVFDKSGPVKLAADFHSLRKSALIAKAGKEPACAGIAGSKFAES